MARNSLDSLLKEARDGRSRVVLRRLGRLPALVAALAPGGTAAIPRATLFEGFDPGEIHSVALRDSTHSMRQQLQRFSQPQDIVLERNFAPIAQQAKEAALERGPGHQGSVQIKKGGDTRTSLFCFSSHRSSGLFHSGRFRRGAFRPAALPHRPRQILPAFQEHGQAAYQAKRRRRPG